MYGKNVVHPSRSCGLDAVPDSRIVSLDAKRSFRECKLKELRITLPARVPGRRRGADAERRRAGIFRGWGLGTAATGKGPVSAKRHEGCRVAHGNAGVKRKRRSFYRSLFPILQTEQSVRRFAISVSPPLLHASL